MNSGEQHVGERQLARETSLAGEDALDVLWEDYH